MTRRSSRAEVRNPVLALLAARLIRAMPANIRAMLAVLLLDLAADARRRSRTSWENRKGIVAAYWATVAAYDVHFARVLGGAAGQPPSSTPLPHIQCGYPDPSRGNWA